MAKILITGAGGYIGSVATYLFLQKGYEVVGIDNFARGFRQPLELLQSKFGEKQFRWYEADLKNDLSPIFEKEKGIQAVAHYGAFCNVDESLTHPELYFANNTWGCAHLVETMVKYNVLHLVFSSTCAVYGQSQYVPLDEKHPVNPITPYGESKHLAEKVVEWYAKLKGLSYVMFRYFNVCGASDDSLIGDSKKPSFHLMQNAIRGAFGIEPFKLTCPQVDTPDKTPIRDYLNVVDLNESHFMGLEYVLKGGQSQAINLGTGTGNSVYEIIKTVEEVTGKKVEVSSGALRKGDPTKLVASIEKAEQVLGWKPKRTIKESVETLVKWYQQHPHGWKN
ncbi:MAG: UDP-glucose 4-epimerase GalE [bacterium]|nr:UDP-glucose 4-epimerase GalE [bacterium]